MNQTEKEALRDYIVSYLIANSQTLNGLSDVTSLDGISSFPVIQEQNDSNYSVKKVPFNMMITDFRYNSGYIQYKDLTTGNWINIISDIELVEKIDLSRYVNIDMDQIINGIKTFNNSPIVPNPITSFQAVNKKYADDALSLKVDKTIEIISGNGLTGGGNLSNDITLNIESANDGVLINSDSIELQTVNDLNSESTTKPLSSLQGKILNDIKVDKTITINNYQLNSNISLSKSDIGLSNVDNTSDINKPISELTQNALNLKADLVNGQVPASQLPSYVDDVLEYPNLLSFPSEGEKGKLYVDLQYNLTYRWSGSIYVEVSKSIALGETDSTAYRGDRGKVAYDHSLSKDNPHSVTKSQVGLSNVDNTSDINKPISTNTQTALNAKADKAITITAGAGLIGGGTIDQSRTISIGATDDSVVVGADGVKVDTQDNLTSTSPTKPLSAKQGKALQDNKADKSCKVNAGAGLSGGGDLDADRTIDVVSANDGITVNVDNIQLNTIDNVTSTSTTKPLSANQGKVLNEKVVQVETNLNEKLEYKADLLNGTVPAEQLPPDLIRTTLYITQVGHRKRRIQDSLGVEDGTMLWTIVSGTEYLASLSETLGLGLYLVSQDLSTYKKLSKTNSNLYADGTPAKLDGTEGDIQMCWRKPIYIKYYEKQEADGLYEHIEISHLNILGECEMIVPGGGFPAVLNRTTGDLRALYSTDPNYRGGNNTASYDSDPIKTLIGKPATNLSAYSGEVAAKKRGQLWTTGGTPFFATLAILQIMLFGTNHAQDTIVSDDVLIAGEGFQSCKKNASGLYSGGFGVYNSFPQWSAYNAYNPTFDLSAGFPFGDITGRRVYIIKDWPTVGTNQTISLAYFFGMPYPFNHYWHGDAHQRVDQQTEAQGFKTVVYQKRDITAAPISGGPSANGVVPSAPWEKVAEGSRTEGYIRRTSFNALCLIPTVAGSPGSSNKFYPDYFYNNGVTSFGWRAPLRFAALADGAVAGPFRVYVYFAPSDAVASFGAFCCHFSSGIVPKKLPG